MCSRVIYRGKAYESQGELKRAVGLAVLPLQSGCVAPPPGPNADNVCLCPVDVREVARRIGVYCEYNGIDYEFQEIDRD